MKALFWLLAVFAGAVALAIIGRGNEGYALFVYPPWRVELSLIFFIVLAVLSILKASSQNLRSKTLLRESYKLGAFRTSPGGIHFGVTPSSGTFHFRFHPTPFMNADR